jgi:peptide/nickel transport system substrate-binding protein
MAINRAEINDALYIGRAEASQIATGTYDPQEAERLLDEMGMDERDSEGYRLAPNGEPFTVPFEVTDNAPDIVPATEVITEHWRDIGIRATMKTVAGGLLSTRQAANEVLVTLDWTERLWHNYVAYNSYGEAWPLWTIWDESGGEEGEEPPEEVQRFLRLTGESLAVAEDRREEIQRQCKDLLRENLWYIEIFDTVPYPLAVNRDIGNIAHRGYTVAANYAAEYYYFK